MTSAVLLMWALMAIVSCSFGFDGRPNNKLAADSLSRVKVLKMAVLEQVCDRCMADCS